MNILNTKGKKILTQKIILNTFYLIKKQLTNVPIFLFFYFLELLRSRFELSVVKIGKKTHEVPIPTNPMRQYLALFRTIKRFFKKSKNHIKFEIKFANEIINVFEKKAQSELLRNKTNMFNKALANRSYLHFR
jgi:ribosomal protein S7